MTAVTHQVKLFNPPKVEIGAGRGATAEQPADEPLRLTLKVETVAPLDEPLVFRFIYTDGTVDKQLREVKLEAPQPHKQKFNVELDVAQFKESVGDLLCPDAVVVDVVYKGTVVGRGTLFMGCSDPSGRYRLEEDDSYDDFEGEEGEELEEMEEFEEFEEGEEAEAK